MTIEVDTPDGVKSGFAVRNIRFAPKDGWGEGGATWGVTGEAVAVDIAPGKTLFALLKGADGGGDHAGYQVWELLTKPQPEVKDGMLMLWPDMPAMQGYVQDKKAGLILPLLVTFTDIADPKSVLKVDPADLAARLGAGVRLKRITVAVTDEAVTSGIGKRLVWLGEYYSKRLDGQRFGDGLSFANSMSSGAFSTEANK
jgi:hypothetical protein